MKLATYCLDGDAPRLGIVHSDSSYIFDLAAAARRAGKEQPAFSSMLDLIDGGQTALDDAGEVFAARAADDGLSVRVEAVELRSPLPEPRQMRDGMSFPTHIRQSPRGMRKIMAAGNQQVLDAIDSEPLPDLPEVYRQLPIYYITNRLIVRGPNTTVIWPRYSKVMDYELEFGIVVGKTAANISVENAREHIFGYTIFNDFSARDQQAKEMPGWLGPAKGKSFDGANVLGPWIVTKDEIPDPYSLRMEARVNGEVRCQSTTEGMLFSFEEILAHMSQDETVFAGEFIGSGTVGNGCGLETGIFLNDGDTIELEVEKIGVLKNTVLRQKD